MIYKIWEATLDKKYTVYVERVEPYKGELTIKDGDKVLTIKAVTISYDAQFGPDVADIDEWQRTSINYIDNELTKSV
jgi:hypothetical protein